MNYYVIVMINLVDHSWCQYNHQNIDRNTCCLHQYSILEHMEITVHQELELHTHS